MSAVSFSSIDGVLTDAPISLPNDLELVISNIYRQVFGNAYLMESERDELRNYESTFRNTLDVPAFILSLALSRTYRARFFECVSQYRFIELQFKHLLGRAPNDAREYAAAHAQYTAAGYESCIEWFVRSAEYEELFGSETVPYGKYKGTYASNELFNRSVALRGTKSSSDKGKKAMLQYAVLSGDSPSWLSIAKALPEGTEKGTGFCVGGQWTSSQRNKNAPVRKGTKVPGGVVFYSG